MDYSGSGPESELRPFLRLMRLWGLWPYGPGGGATAHWFYVRCTMLCQLVISVQQLIQMTLYRDLNNISSAVEIATLTLAALYRQAVFTFFVGDFERITAKVDANFMPHRMPRRFRFDGKWWMRRSKMYTYAYLSLAALLVAVWVASRVYDNIRIAAIEKASALSPSETHSTETEQSSLNATLSYREMSAEHPKKKRRLLINCWYPFDSAASPAFEMAFVWEIATSLYCGFAYVVSDLYLFAVVHLICGQLEIVKSSFRLMRESFAEHRLGADRVRAFALARMERDVARCVDYHCAVIGLIGDLDRALRTLIVVDFLHAVASLSFAMLQTVIADTSNEWLQMLIFIGVSVLHQFLNNLFAESLAAAQESVAEAAYGAPWPDPVAPPALRAAVVVAVVQARRPVRLSGWKMYVLGNATFVEFMRRLFSYFLVLQSLHAKEREGRA